MIIVFWEVYIMLLEEEKLEGIQMISNRMKELRKKRNVKVSDISEYLNISLQYYYDLEKGVKRLNEDVIHKLADFYSVSADYIMNRTEYENNIILQKKDIPDELKEYVDSLSLIGDKSLTPEEVKSILQVAIKLKGKN